MNLAAIRADRTLAEQRIVRRQFLHLRHHLGTIMRIAAEGVERLEIMDQT